MDMNLLCKEKKNTLGKNRVENNNAAKKRQNENPRAYSNG